MGILGALFSGVSGLDVYSNAIEVIGNNIANTNTAGFKASRAEFSDILAQSLSGAGTGSQIGRGVQLAAVTTQFTQGSFETTSSGTDLAIDGSGFFIVKNNDGVFYTRAGQFAVNAQGLLVNSKGDRVQGVLLDTSGNPSGTVQDLNLTVTNSPPKVTAKVNFVANLDASAATLGTSGTATSGNTVTDRFQFLTGTNDVIRFNDGSVRTASLTTNGLLVSGAQYSASAVATAIETALEATNAGADGYTVTYSATTKKFTIANDGGNANSITLLHSDAASTASDDLGFSTAADDVVAVGSSASSDNQVQFNVVAGRNTFTIDVDGNYYATQKTATVAAGAYTADGLSQAIETAINASDSGDSLDRLRAVRVNYDAGSNIDKFQISSQTAGAARTIDISSDSNAFTISASSIVVAESNLGVLGLVNMGTDETFTITQGFNDAIRVDFDSVGGGGASTISLITDGGLVNGAVVTATQLAAALQTALNTDPGGGGTDAYTVTYNSSTDRFTIDAAGGNADAIDILWTDAATTAEALLGFTADDTIAAGANVTGDTSLTTSLAAASQVNTNGTGSFSVTDPSNLGSSSFSTSLTVFDSLGSSHSLNIFFRKIGENIWEYNGLMPGDDVVGPTADGKNEQVLYGRLWFSKTGALDIEDQYVGPTNPDGSTNTADANGFLFPKANRFNFEGGAKGDQLITFDFGTSISTDSSSTGGLNGLTQFAGSSAIINQTQDGFTTGTLQSIAVNRNGNVTGQFTNGQTRDLARIMLANFNAPQGLSSQGSSLFAETQGSGQPILGQATTAGFGSVLSNSIELSNVDIAEEFVKLIQDQQAFQANARIISTTEDLLDEVVNLTR